MKTNQISNEALRFIIDYASEHRGTVKELTARLSKALGKPVHRQLVEGWLNHDPENRVEPKLGLGLVIITEARALIDGKVKPLDLRAIIRKANNGKQ